MKVLKFGGTSVGTVSSVTAIQNIASRITTPMVIVVSALGGVTDKLISTAKKASEGDSTYIDDYTTICDRHFAMVEGLIHDDHTRSKLLEDLGSLLAQLGDLFKGIALIGSLPSETLDITVSFGERMSSLIIAAAIPGAEHFDSLDIIKTEKWFNKNIADTELTTTLLKDHLGKRSSRIAVMGGFISTDRDSGTITNLGRGGSDYTAALVAAAFDADALEIWTDVDGFMTTDPRMIPSAKVMNEMSFVESMELCSFGAKVIYPPTIYPVFHKNIPIRILNTFNPSAPGTLITDSPHTCGEQCPVRGISSLPGTSLISVKGRKVENLAEINSRIFNSLAKKGIRVILVTQPEIESHIAFVVSSPETSEAMQALDEEFAPELSSGSLTGIEVEHDLTTVAIVGEGITQSHGISSRVSHTLRREGIIPLATSSATSQTTISFVVRNEDTSKAIALLHSYFFDTKG